MRRVLEYWERRQQLLTGVRGGGAMCRKTLTGDSLSKHGFFGAKTSHPPLYQMVKASIHFLVK